MKFILYSKFKVFDLGGVNLVDLMHSLSDSLLDSGYNENYWWTRQRNETDDSLDALRVAYTQATLATATLVEEEVEEILLEKKRKEKGKVLGEGKKE